MNNKERYQLIKLALNNDGGMPRNMMSAAPSAPRKSGDGGSALNTAAQTLTDAAGGSGLGIATKGLRLAGNVGKSPASSVGAQSGRQFASGQQSAPNQPAMQSAMQRFRSPLMAAPR